MLLHLVWGTSLNISIQNEKENTIPSYDYMCESCGNKFERTLKISDRNMPTEVPCEKCNETKVIKTLERAPDWTDGVRMKTAVTGGFRDVLERVHMTNPKSNINQKYNSVR